MKKLLLLLIACSMFVQTIYAQVISKKLVAHSYYENGSKLDSNHYYYSGARASVHNSLESYADSYFPDGINNQNIFSDSSVRWDNLLSWRPTEITRKAYTYDATGKLTRMTVTRSDVMHYDMTYDAQNRLETMTWSSALGGPVIPRHKHYYEYNLQNKLVKDSAYELVANNPLYSIYYNYDVNGNKIEQKGYSMNAGIWSEYYKHELLYDGFNRLLRIIRFNTPSGGPIEPTSLDTFGYTGNISSEYTYMANYSRDPFNTYWVGINRYVRHLDFNNRIDQYDIHQWNGISWDTLERGVCVYDNEGLLQYINGYQYVAGSAFAPNPNAKHNYYYEDIFPLKTNDLSKEKNKLILYPNPTSDKLFIETIEEASDYLLINMTGQIVQRGSVKSNKYISVKQLPTGYYMMSVLVNGKPSVSATFHKQ